MHSSIKLSQEQLPCIGEERERCMVGDKLRVTKKNRPSTITKTRNAKNLKNTVHGHRTITKINVRSVRTGGETRVRRTKLIPRISFHFFFLCLLTEFVELSTYYRPRVMITRWLWCVFVCTRYFSFARRLRSIEHRFDRCLFQVLFQSRSSSPVSQKN